MNHTTAILGAGVAGLGAAWASQCPVYEAEPRAGGLCSTYFMQPGCAVRTYDMNNNGPAYRFDWGGGHWIFPGPKPVQHLLSNLCSLKIYARDSAVFFPSSGLCVPFPLQNHLAYLDGSVREKALREILLARGGPVNTMSAWLEQSFGATLAELFFAPFHDLYTAGLSNSIAPQDEYKSPVDRSLVIGGAFQRTPSVGYNACFVYPKDGLTQLTRRLRGSGTIHFGKRVVRVDLGNREVQFSDGSGFHYKNLIATTPLHAMQEWTGLTTVGEPDPYTSVLVLNIGAVRGSRCPRAHWVYLPTSDSGFHRVGFYSNVDEAFAPAARDGQSRVAIYVERSYRSKARPGERQIQSYVDAVLRELRAWDFIAEVEIVDPVWVEVAYTWSRPASQWRADLLSQLEAKGIFMAGRYGRWNFQGIAQSIGEGLLLGAALKNYC